MWVLFVQWRPFLMVSLQCPLGVGSQRGPESLPDMSASCLLSQARTTHTHHMEQISGWCSQSEPKHVGQSPGPCLLFNTRTNEALPDAHALSAPASPLLSRPSKQRYSALRYAKAMPQGFKWDTWSCSRGKQRRGLQWRNIYSHQPSY